jgi:hypothetical protein
VGLERTAGAAGSGHSFRRGKEQLVTTTLRQTDFSGGEVSPTFWGRSDLKRYHSALRDCENLIPLPHGAAVLRPGFRYCGTPKTGAARLVGFRFSDDSQVVMEIGNGYVRFWIDGDQVQAHDAAAWDTLVTYPVDAMVSHNSKYWKALRETIGDDPDSSASDWVEVTSTTAYEIAVAFGLADLAKMKFVQSGDVLYVTHQGYTPYAITRSGKTIWSAAALSFVPAAMSDTVVWTSGDVATAPLRTWEWVVTDLGAQAPSAQVDCKGETRACTKLSKSCALGSGVVPAIIGWTGTAGHTYNVYRGRNGIFGWVGQSPTNAFNDDGLEPDFSWGPPQGTNPFDGANKYPAAAAFIDDRLCFAGTFNKPQTLWGSRVGDYYRMDKQFPLSKDAAFEWMVASRNLQEIRSLVGLRSLIALTSGGVWVIDGGNDPLSPLSVRARQHSYVGASWLDPLVIGTNIIYEPNQGNGVVELAFTADQGAYAPRDLTTYARHFVEGCTITAWCYQAKPHPVIWMTVHNNDPIGTQKSRFVTLTYLQDLDVWAWAEQKTYGNAGSSIGVEVCPSSFCVVTEAGEDIVYMIVNRGTTATIERSNPHNYSYGSNPAELLLAQFLDCAYFSYGMEIGDSGNVNNLSLTSVTSWGVGGTAAAATAADTFTAGDVGRHIILNPAAYDTALPIVHCRITAYVGKRSVTVEFLDDFTEWEGHVTGINAAKTGTSIINLPAYFYNRQVYVYSEGRLQGPYTVNGSGTISGLTTPVFRSYVGVPYTGAAELLDAAPQQLALKEKRVVRVGFEVAYSRGAWIGVDADTLVEVEPDNPKGEYSCRSRSAILEAAVDSGYDINGRCRIEARGATPFQLTAVIREIDVGG